MIQRYDYCDIENNFHNYKEMRESDHGDFVFYDDYANEIAEKDKEIERLRHAIQCALAISDLWVWHLTPTLEEFEVEAQALNSMKQQFEEALKEKP